MKRLLIIVFIAFTQLTYGKNTVYVLVWGSTQTQSGAGHTSIAFSDSNGIHYYSSYSRGDGGIIDTFLCEVNEVFGLDSAIGLQASSPSLILSFEVNEHEYQEGKNPTGTAAVPIAPPNSSGNNPAHTTEKKPSKEINSSSKGNDNFWGNSSTNSTINKKAA